MAEVREAAQDAGEPPWLGPCCACGEERPLRNLVDLPVRGPKPGMGWGCLVCKLPADGALAVLCDGCVGELDELGLPKQLAEIRWACAGYASEPERVERARLQEPFDHDRAEHADELAAWQAHQAARESQADGDEDLDLVDDGEDLPGDTERCRYVEPTWAGRDVDEDLHKCAGCNRFFVQRVPIIAFLGEGENCLQLEVCDNCTPKLLGRARVRAV